MRLASGMVHGADVGVLVSAAGFPYGFAAAHRRAERAVPIPAVAEAADEDLDPAASALEATTGRRHGPTATCKSVWTSVTPSAILLPAMIEGRRRATSKPGSPDPGFFLLGRRRFYSGQRWIR